jgi:hypothetical protein
MSLDVHLEGPRTKRKCTSCWGAGEIEECDDYFSANITHNLNKMAGEAGIYEAMWRPEEIGVTKAAQLVPLLKEGLARLESDPAHFKKFNPENGWGSYEGLVNFVRKYLEACEGSPDAVVRASR